MSLIDKKKCLAVNSLIKQADCPTHDPHLSVQCIANNIQQQPILVGWPQRQKIQQINIQYSLIQSIKAICIQLQLILADCQIQPSFSLLQPITPSYRHAQPIIANYIQLLTSLTIKGNYIQIQPFVVHYSQVQPNLTNYRHFKANNGL